MTAPSDPIFALPRGVRLKWDAVRACHVLLGPERALMLDDIGHAIMTELDGASRVSDIAARLAARFSAPVDVVQPDVADFLAGLHAKRLLEAR